MENLIATAIGASIDRQDGDSGVKGAVLGYVAAATIKSTVRLGFLVALGYGAYRIARRVTDANAA